MEDSFTLNELILHAYNDSDEIRDRKLHDKLDEDECLKNELKTILETRYLLESNLVSPGKRLVDNILSYSRSLTVIKTKSVGDINLLMN